MSGAQDRTGHCQRGRKILGASLTSLTKRRIMEQNWIVFVEKTVSEIIKVSAFTRDDAKEEVKRTRKDVKILTVKKSSELTDDFDKWVDRLTERLKCKQQ